MVTVSEKHCPSCETTKPASEFHRHKARKDGLGAYCKTCHRERVDKDKQRERVKEWRAANPERAKAISARANAKTRAAKPPKPLPIPPTPGFKRCTKCENEKLLAEFSTARSFKDGLHYWCKACCSESHKAYAAVPGNAEKIRARQKAWVQTPDGLAKRRAASKRHYDRNPQRCADLANACKKKNREAIREQIKDALGGCCAKCGLDERRILQIDHVAGGGSAERRNLGEERMLRKVLAAALANTGEYQLLCPNDNWRKRLDSPNEQANHKRLGPRKPKV